MQFDAIVLGSSPNELTCAGTLAKSGAKVLVLESGASIGGVCAPVAFAEGFRAAVAPAEAGHVPAAVIKALDLASHGWDGRAPLQPMVALGSEGDALVFSPDSKKTREAIAARNKEDAGKWDAFAGQIARLAGFLESLYDSPAVELIEPAPGDLIALAGHGLRLRRMGKSDMVEMLRVLPMSAWDLLDDWFADDVLKAGLAATSVANLFQGPKSAGTGFTFLHHHVGRPMGAFGTRAFATGEKNNLVSAMAGALRKLGVEVRTGVDAHVRVENGRAVGVTAGGETIAAKMVASGADPKRACFTQIDPWSFPPEFARPVSHVKMRGVRAVMMFAVDAAPTFKGVGPDLAKGTIVAAPTMEWIERAFDAAKHGVLPERPTLEITVPSLHDPSLAPAGQHVVHVAVQSIGHKVNAEGLGARIIERLDALAPGFKASIKGQKLWTPSDIERDFGLTEGQLYGGELTLDQILFMRPVGGFAHYATPVPGYFLCGDATHPGGAIIGAAGHLAAQRMMKG